MYKPVSAVLAYILFYLFAFLSPYEIKYYYDKVCYSVCKNLV